MKKYNWAWFKEKGATIKNIIFPMSKIFLIGVSISFLVYGAVLVFIYITYQLSNVVEITISEDKLSYLNSTSSLLLLLVTTAYVVLTYNILKTTEESTKQSEKVVQQTANAQKIAYLERRLELFYLPMTNALKAASIESIRLSEYILKKTSNKEQYPFDFNDLLNKIVSGFIDNHTTCMNFSYLAPNETVQHLNEFQKLFIETFKQYLGPVHIETEIAFTDEYSTSYNTIKMEMENDIEVLKAELAELVNYSSPFSTHCSF